MESWGLCETWKLFFTGEEYIRLKNFLEEMSDQTVEITPFNVAYYYVYYCKQNKIKVIESKVDIYIEKIAKTINFRPTERGIQEYIN